MSSLSASCVSPVPTAPNAPVLLATCVACAALATARRPDRIAENFDVFDFELTPDELASIDALDTGMRGGPEPADVTLENYGRPIPEA